MRRLLRAAVLAAVVLALPAGKPVSKYAEGQVWEYRTRPQDAGSLLKIQRIEPDSTGQIFHLSIIGVHFRNPQVTGVLPHIPVSEATLDASVTRLSTAKADFPTAALDAGIAEWRRANGGVFTISVSKILDIVDDQASRLPNTAATGSVS